MMRRVCILGLLCMWAGAWCAHAQAPAPAPAPATPPPPAAPNPQDVKQVNVSVKIVEFQTTKGVESGLSAYFLHRDQKRGFSHVSMGNGTLRSADITFPTNTASAITVFLDQLHIGEGDLEVMLQGLVDQDRAFILSQPKAMVTVSSPIPTTIQTTQRIPYENTVVVGATAVQTTAFRDTGVSLTVQAPEIIDDDGNPTTADDTYIKLLISAAVNEEGQRIVVALDDRMAAQGIFGQASNAIKVPEFVSRSVATSVWVRHGQVLLLGGLYRNTKNKSLSTLPWLTQSEDLVMGLADKVLPTESLGSPLSSTVGDRTTNEGRRELVFLIKAELWKPAYTVFRDLTMGEEPSADGKKKPSLTGVIQGITDIPKGLVQGIRGDESQSNTVESGIGGGSK